jgi:hypothetical protein
MFGPALAQRSTRVLEGEEKEAHMAKYKSEAPKKLTPVEKAASITQVRADLALEDSSDEEEARNPMEQKYNSYGKEMKQRIAREQQNQVQEVWHSRKQDDTLSDILSCCRETVCRPPVPAATTTLSPKPWDSTRRPAPPST